MPAAEEQPRLQTFAATRVFGSLDGLRCLSIGSVVWHHAATHPHTLPLASNGFLGVDLFFVISGFLITTLLLRERAAHGRISLRDFWIRRALRIFPPYFALLLATSVALGWLFPRAHMRAPFFAELPYLATYTSNWVELSTFFAITWSLATEEQFYLLWPLVERFLAGFVGPALALGLALNEAVNFGLLDGPLARAGLARPELPVLQATFTPILLGVALAHTLAWPRGFAACACALGQRPAAPLALAAVLALASLPGSLSGLPRLAIHVAMATLVAACVLREDNGLARFLRLRPIARVGAVSYGVYLFHMLALHVVLLWKLPDAPLANAAQFGGCALGAAAIAEFSYRMLEQRFLRLKARFAVGAGR